MLKLKLIKKKTKFPMEETDLKEHQKKTILTFGFASFLNDLGSEIAHSIWPVFVKEILKAPMSVLGLIDGLGEATVSFSQTFAGWFSDKLGKRKPFIWLGYLMSGLARVGYSITYFWGLLFPFKIFDRAGKIRETPRDVLVLEIANHKYKARTIGFLDAMDHLGAVSGIVLAIILIKFFTPREMFFMAALPSLIAGYLILSLIKEKSSPLQISPLKFSPGKFAQPLKIFFFANLLFSLGFFSYSFLLIYARENGWKLESVPVLYLILTMAMMLMAYPVSWLADKIGKKRTIILAYLFWNFSSLGFILGAKNSLIIPLLVLFGFSKATLRPSQVAFISEFSHHLFKGRTLGFFQMISGLCFLIASSLAGFFWQFFGAKTTFLFAFLTSISAILMMLFVKEK